MHDLEVMGWNPSQVELGVCGTFKVILEPKISIASESVYLRARACFASGLKDNVAVHFLKASVLETMKCTVHDLEVMGSNFECVALLPK